MRIPDGIRLIWPLHTAVPGNIGRSPVKTSLERTSCMPDVTIHLRRTAMGWSRQNVIKRDRKHVRGGSEILSADRKKKLTLTAVQWNDSIVVAAALTTR